MRLPYARAVLPATALLLLAVAGCGGADPAAPRGPVARPGTAVNVIPVTSTAAPGKQSWAPWPQALHDARHSGASTSAGPQRGTVVWRRHLSDGALPAGPVVGADGTIYVVDGDGLLHAVDPSTGKDRWSAGTGTPVGGDLSISALVLPDGSVVAAAHGGLTAWSPTGRRLWSVTLDGSLTSPVTVDGRRIYVGTRGGHVAAVDVTSGGGASLAWDVATGAGSSYGSVVTDGRGQVFTTTETGLVAVRDNGTTASVQWTGDPKDGAVDVSAGLSASGVVLLGTNGHHEWAYDRAGKLLWKADREETYSSPSVTEDGLAYVGEHNSQVHVFDVTSGRQVGRYPTAVGDTTGKTGVWTSVMVDSRHDIYFGTRTHFLVGVRPDGSRLFTVDLGTSTSSYPALTGDGAIVIGTDAGDLLLVR